jgi:DNA topoisomerase I
MKGRKQYIYNKDYINEQTEIKFCDLIKFGKKIKKIRKDINQSLKSKFILGRFQVIYIMLFLIDSCNFRIGSEKYRKLYKTHGVTTLNKNHFKFNANSVEIKFVGKKGVLNYSKIRNKKIIERLKILYKNFVNRDHIFNYVENGKVFHINEKTVNNFLQKYHKMISVKMFRTWNANYFLLKILIDLPEPQNKKECDKNVSHIIKYVASRLHHTPNVSKKSYINNSILSLYKNDFKKFFNIIENISKSRVPSIDRILTEFLSLLCKN